MRGLADIVGLVGHFKDLFCYPHVGNVPEGLRIGMTKFGVHFKGAHGKLCDDNRYGDQLEYYYDNTDEMRWWLRPIW